VGRLLATCSKEEYETILYCLHHALLEDTAETRTSSHERGLDQFRFLAGSSIRGDSGCAHLDCRLGKVQALARYAALYADEIVIPVELPHFGGYEDDLLARLGVAATICLALELRPLIEEGIVKLELPLFGFCKECGLAHRKREREVLRKARQLYEKEIDRFSLRYTPATAERHGFVEMMGPPEYLEHGLIIWKYLKEPAWAPKRPIKRPPRTLSRTVVRRSKLVRRLFDGLADDLVDQQLWGMGFDLKYLTASEGDIRFASWLSSGVNGELRLPGSAARLTHSIPILGDLSIRSVLKVRRDDRESFLIYRDTITNILKDHLSRGSELSERDTNQIYNDVQRPELIRLERAVRDHRRAHRRDTLAKLVGPAAVMSLGFASGLVPNELQKLFVALGGLKVLNDMTEAVASIRERPDEVRNHSLYFLLQLAQDG